MGGFWIGSHFKFPLDLCNVISIKESDLCIDYLATHSWGFLFVGRWLDLVKEIV